MNSLLTLAALILPIAALAQNTEMPANKQAPSEPPGMRAPKDSRSDVKGSIKMAHVVFVAPKDGDTVAKEFTAKFKVDGMKVAPAGDMSPGSGHFHVLIDTPVIAKGQVIPTDDKHMHFGKAQMEAKMKLTPGKHTLTLLLADGAHRSYGEEMSHTITVTVK
jgi:hypothetical protein